MLDGWGKLGQLTNRLVLVVVQVLWAKKLGVNVDDVKGQMWADLFLFKDVPSTLVLVAWDETSPAYQLKDSLLKEKGVVVILRAEEAVSNRKSGFCFEVFGMPYATHPWGEARVVTRKLRTLALASQKQAKRAGVPAPFGDAYRMKDFVGLIGSKTPRRTFVTLGLAGGLSSVRMMQRTEHDNPAMMLRYADPDEKIYDKDGENISDVILRGAVVGEMTQEGLAAALLRTT